MEELIEKYKYIDIKWRLILVFFAAVAYPIFEYTEELEIRTAELESAIASRQGAQTKLDRAKRKLVNLPQMEAENAELMAKLEKARRYLPDHIAFESLLATFGGFETDLEVRLLKFIPGEEKQGDKRLSYSEVMLDIELLGDFNQVMIFLDKVVHLENLVHIRKMSFTPDQSQVSVNTGGEEQPYTGTVNAKIELVFFRSSLNAGGS